MCPTDEDLTPQVKVGQQGFKDIGRLTQLCQRPQHVVHRHEPTVNNAKWKGRQARGHPHCDGSHAAHGLDEASPDNLTEPRASILEINLVQHQQLIKTEKMGCTMDV